jgi:hypothetical protein
MMRKEKQRIGVSEPVTYRQTTRGQQASDQTRRQSLKVARPTTLKRLPLRCQAWCKVVSSPLTVLRAYCFAVKRAARIKKVKGPLVAFVHTALPVTWD